MSETEAQARARVRAGVSRPGALRVLVTGGRRYANSFQFGAVLGGIANQSGIRRIIDGGATGADAMAQNFAKWAGIPSETYPADWARHGKAAGPLRNTWMLDHSKPDLVVAFPGGRGTADMVAKARAAGVSVLEVDP